ncbi:hypothetical protein ACFYVR_16825 [Rhodococcus sp. NPDC003318]|uniref:hypothetical protein n=1 Tax=Rhodococcus sp. NPDC003318 TaxID=3364503 RepID=UPI0036A3B24C
MRAAATAAAVSAVIGAVGGAAATAAPVPSLFPAGQTIAVVGQNSGCSGLIDYTLDTDPAKPGVVAVMLVSRGMNGIGPAWDANPVCPIDFDIMWDAAYFGFGSVAGNQREAVEFNPTTRPGDSLRTEIFTGGGLHVLSITAGYVSPAYNELRPQISFAGGGYILVP